MIYHADIQQTPFCIDWKALKQSRVNREHFCIEYAFRSFLKVLATKDFENSILVPLIDTKVDLVREIELLIITRGTC